MTTARNIANAKLTIGSTTISLGSTAVTTISGLTLSGATLTGSLTAGGSAGTSGYLLSSTGTGVQWITPPAGYLAPTIGSTQIASNTTYTTLPGVTSVNGTTIPLNGTLITSATTSLPSVTSVNGISLTPATTGFSIAGGSTTSKTLTLSNTLTLAGTDASTLNIGAGGTLGTAAFTASTSYATSGANTNITSLGGLTTPLSVSQGGTGTGTAGITAFNNITGYTASGTTGTTSTNLVFSTSPSLTTPTLGVATATSINKMSITAPATSSTLAVADGKTFTSSNTITLTATDGSTLAIGGGGTLGTAAYTASTAYQTSNTTLTGVAGLSSSGTGLVKNTAGTWSYDTNAYITGSSPTITSPAISAGTATLAPIKFTPTGAVLLNTPVAGALEVDLSGVLYYTTSSTRQAVALGATLSNPMTTLGDMISGGAAGAATRLVGPTTNGTYGLTSIPTAGVAVAPTWTLATGTGAPVYATSPTLSSPILTTPKVDTINTNTGVGTAATLFGDVTTGSITEGAGLTSGSHNIASGTTFAGTVAIANASTSAHTISISNGASTANKTINIGTSSTGGTTAIALGSTSGATSTIALNGAVTASSTINKVTITAPTTSATLTLITGSTLATGTAASLTLSLSSAAATVATIPSGTVILMDLGTAQTITGVKTASAGTTATASQIGYMGLPQTLNPGAYTLTAADNGKHIYYTTTAQTLTIPANTALALPIGFSCVVINAAAVSTSIAITTDSLLLAGTGTTGTRTLAAYGMATLVKITATSWIISGNGLT